MTPSLVNVTLRAKAMLNAIGNAVYPPVCVGCGLPGEFEIHPVCAVCADTMNALERESRCPRCAATVGPHEVKDGRCRSCHDAKERVAGTVRVGEYSERFGTMIRRYKYHGREELEPLLGERLGRAIRSAPWFDRIEAVLPVPTHWRHQVGRPYYPAERLAAIVQRETGKPNLAILRRTRGGPHQIGLSATERISNVRGAFAVRVHVRLADARLLVIDDVKTTGATINECAKVLRRAGAAEVYAAVLCTADHR